MSASSLILVTGVSGFLGSHVVHKLLEAGYRVRGTARSQKVAFVQGWYTQYGDRVQIVALDDLIHGDYSAALKDVEAVIHVAAPLVGRAATHAAQIDAAVEGTRNILVQGEKAGIKKFSIVSSIVAVSPVQTLGHGLGAPVTDKDWNPVTREQGLNPAADGFTVYAAEKTLAEQFVWEFADKHPHVDITTVNPPFFLGPLAPEWRASQPGVAALSTDVFIYFLLSRDGALMPHPAAIDVRDVAQALVLSLTAPPASAVGRKRLILTGEWVSPKEDAAYIAEVRPGLKGRLSEAWKKAGPAVKNNIDTSRAREVLGLEFTEHRKTLLDAVDSIVATETEWKQQGWVPSN